ncbi:uncharacterized protein TrAtP1_004707 [Trichoderma atroviride]|uniref:Uncharacterized protein n=1 Tax=Hypocrea atroviridis (strain ATCC 20476 / IMI 206040) TaxID=452589 RepID=G9P525_HYPAI|nr:uncharacterized protein TRIATDRAFT_301880 [Trichoderma atroviride IMI 206040]EHK41265.1 hypothetical protein TRIATDRAFT_301880 [Trichoderma atroviride IMI 206040]UKZ63478.1 hypothetical protein TrAtP1_004707 [Trichoderma atroviride]
MDTKSSNPRLTSESLSLSSGSNFSTPSASLASTPTLEAREFISGVPPKVSTNPLPPLLRAYPQPAKDIDVEEALERQPGRWSLQGQMKANQKRAQIAASRSDDKEQKTRDFETAKRELLAFHEGTLQNASGRK